MTSRLWKPLPIAILCAAVAVASAAAGYFYAKKESNTEQLQSFYSSRAGDVRFEVGTLTLMRSNQIDKALKMQEGLLSLDLISLSQYETNLQKRERSSEIYKAVAVVRDYYKRFPSANPSPYAKDALALGLATKPAP